MAGGSPIADPPPLARWRPQALIAAACAATLLYVVVEPQFDTGSAPLPMPPAALSLTPDVQVALTATPPAGTPLDWVAEGRVLPVPPHGALHEWPGTALLARFEGDAVAITLDDAENRFRVVIDGRPSAEITRPGAATVALAGFGPGPHDLRLERLSEAGAPQLVGSITVPPTGRPLPPPALPARRIDVYGDSDSVGYGLLRGDRRCSGNDAFLSTDTTLAWPALVARHHGATVDVMARSGIGLIRGFDGSPPEGNLLALHRRALPSDPRLAAAARPPWLTVVEVGGNDFALPAQGGEAAFSEAFTRAYGAFLRERAGQAPVLVLGLPDAGSDLRPEIAGVANALQAEGLPVRLVTVDGLDYLACDWHPSRADHERAAAAAGAAIEGLIAEGLLEDR